MKLRVEIDLCSPVWNVFSKNIIRATKVTCLHWQTNFVILIDWRAKQKLWHFSTRCKLTSKTVKKPDSPLLFWVWKSQLPVLLWYQYFLSRFPLLNGTFVKVQSCWFWIVGSSVQQAMKSLSFAFVYLVLSWTFRFYPWGSKLNSFVRVSKNCVIYQSLELLLKKLNFTF